MEQKIIKGKNIITAVTDKRTQELLPIYMFSAGHGHDQEYRNRLTDSPYYHFMYVEDGEGIFEFPDGKYTVEKGTIVFFRKNYPVIYRRKKNVFVTAWVSFDGSLVDKILEYLHAENYAFFKSDNVWQIMKSIYKKASENASPEVLSSNVYKLIIAYFNEMNKEKSPSVLAKVKEYIENNYSEDISVADMARVAEVSESFVYRLFREKENMTPVEYLQNTRVEKAKHILMTNEAIGISEISEACGFSISAYFCKVFRNFTQMTPNTYRKTYFY